MSTTFEDLPSKQQTFIDLYLDLGDRDEAYKEAKYSIEGRAWKANARALFLKLQHCIEQRIETRIGEGALLSLKVIKDLMMTAKSESIKLKAALEYRDMGGLGRTKVERPEQTPEQDLTDKELDEEIASLTGKVIIHGSTALQ